MRQEAEVPVRLTSTMPPSVEFDVKPRGVSGPHFLGTRLDLGSSDQITETNVNAVAGRFSVSCVVACSR